MNINGRDYRKRDIPVIGVSFVLSRIKGQSFRSSLIRPIVVKSDEGLRWYFSGKHHDNIAFRRTHEPEISNLLIGMSDRTKVFVDVGAHVGRYSIRFAKKGAVVHAFEPNPTNREILEKNCELNNLRINIHACALGSEKTEATITMDADKSRVGVGTVTVPVNALDSYHIDNIDLIKIDTEGYEAEVLKGSIETLKNDRPTLLIEVHEADKGVECMHILNKCGYAKIDKLGEEIPFHLLAE